MNRFAGFAASAAALLAACGQGGGVKTTEMIDSCAVLESIDAPGLIDAAFDPPERLRDLEAGGNAGKMSSCGLTSAVGEDAAGLAQLKAQLQNTWFVTLMAWTWPDADSARAYMDSMRRASMDGIEPENVNGLGDEAVWGGSMHARHGNVTITLDVRGPAEEVGEKSEKELEAELSRRALKQLE